MPKDYDLFMIDRNRRLRDENHQYDFIVCLDKSLGFVAKVILFKGDAWRMYCRELENVENDDVVQCCKEFSSGNAGIAVVVLDFLYYFELTEENKTRIASLLKRALKKYMNAEVALTVPETKEYSIASQVKVLEDILNDLRSGYSKMSDHIGKENADYYIGCVERAIESVKLLGKVVS